MEEYTDIQCSWLADCCGHVCRISIHECSEDVLRFGRLPQTKSEQRWLKTKDYTNIFTDVSNEKEV